MLIRAPRSNDSRRNALDTEIRDQTTLRFAIKAKKYGTLRCYYWPGSDDIAPDLLDAMEAISEGAEASPPSPVNAADNQGRCAEPSTAG